MRIAMMAGGNLYGTTTMRILLLLVGLPLFGGCIDNPEPQFPQVQVWRTAYGSGPPPGPVISTYGSHVILFKDGPILLRMYLIDNGSKKLVTSLSVEPELHHMVAITPTIREEKGRVEILAPYTRRWDGGFQQGMDFKEITFPIPHCFGCNLIGSSKTPLKREEQLLRYFIYESDEVDTTWGESISMEAMLKTSSRKNVSFVVVTAAPTVP